MSEWVKSFSMVQGQLKHSGLENARPQNVTPGEYGKPGVRVKVNTTQIMYPWQNVVNYRRLYENISANTLSMNALQTATPQYLAAALRCLVSLLSTKLKYTLTTTELSLSLLTCCQQQWLSVLDNLFWRNSALESFHVALWWPVTVVHPNETRKSCTRQ